MSQIIPVNGAVCEVSDGANLPCLNSNISIIEEINNKKISTQHRKTAFILKYSIEQLAQKFGINRMGFLTLTFADHVTCPKEAQRRLNSLISNVIKKRYLEYVGVFERQKSGRIHYHLLVILKEGIRKGFSFMEIANKNYRSANSFLRKEWAYWRETSKSYGFGRTELMPVKSNVEAIAKYIGKYISKHVENRTEADKGVRLVRYSKGARVGTTRFMFNSDGSRQWRRKVARFARMVETGGLRFRLPHDLLRHYVPDLEVMSVDTLDGITRKLGDARWAYRYREFILGL